MGLPAEALGDAEEGEPEPLEIWPENWPVVEIFLALSTQWNVSGMGVLTGINYPAMEMVFRIHEVEDRRAMFNDLRIMERAALGVLNRGE